GVETAVLFFLHEPLAVSELARAIVHAPRVRDAAKLRLLRRFSRGAILLDLRSLPALFFVRIEPPRVERPGADLDRGAELELPREQDARRLDERIAEPRRAVARFRAPLDRRAERRAEPPGLVIGPDERADFRCDAVHRDLVRLPSQAELNRRARARAGV